MFQEKVLSVLSAHLGQTGLIYYDLLILVLMSALGVGCYFEWQGRRLPNGIARPSLLLVIVLRFLVGGPSDWIVVVLIIWGYFFWTWTKGFIGAGDAKGLMVLTAIWPTWWLCLLYFVWWGVISGVLYSLWAYIRLRRQPGTWWLMLASLPRHVLTPEPQLHKREVLLIPSLIITIIFYLLIGRPQLLTGSTISWLGILAGSLM